MTDSPSPRPHRARGPMPTSGILVLAIVVVVLLAVVSLGCAVLWDAVNPGEWTAAGWAAAGSWFAGGGTLLAVGVALHASKSARDDARREVEAAEARAEQALWSVRRDREISALAALSYPVRSLCFELTALERRIKGFIATDGFYTRDPLPAVSSDAGALLERLEHFASNDLLHAFKALDEARILVHVQEARSLINTLHIELESVATTITNWRRDLWNQGAPDLAEEGKHADFLAQCLVQVREVVDRAYPDSRRGLSDDAHNRGAGDATMTP